MRNTRFPCPATLRTRHLLAAVLVGLGAAIAHGQHGSSVALSNAISERRNRPPGVCPPFLLRDEEGNAINPVTRKNSDKPYSPKQTCGQCHDYEKITRGYHFTQGAGEPPTPDQKARCQWALTPGNYGGTWCSPAPLYKYLSPKKNESAAVMDMTSFTFFTMPCAACHPGGGSAEFDRDGKRYDRWMSDPASGFASGADNNLDGDYYRARWTDTGVIEADCLLCHMPEYSGSERKKQLSAWNFRWAATAGAGFAKVTGSVKDKENVELSYNQERFGKEGMVEPHIVREPRNEACLGCHAKPGWKKRGANFRARTDVHLRAGLKCVDCHPAGSSATDPRIATREEHQFGKETTQVGTCATTWTTPASHVPTATIPGEWVPRLRNTAGCRRCTCSRSLARHVTSRSER